MDSNKSFYKNVLIVICIVVCGIAYPSASDEIDNEKNRAQKSAFELVVDKNNPEKPIKLRFLSANTKLCKLNLEFFSQIKFYITELVDGKEEHIFACNSFSNRAVQPSSKFATITVSKDTFTYNKKFTEQFLDFFREVIVDNKLRTGAIKEFKVVVGLRNIFVDDSQQPGEVFTVYNETILDEKTFRYFFDIISKK